MQQEIKNQTNEFSFALKPSQFGVGVFAVHDIKKSAHLRLFGGMETVAVERRKEDIPEFFKTYCVDRGEIMMCPRDFGCMEVGWFLNHSDKPNAYHENYEYYALRDIKEGEEITIDYNSLEESEESKEYYYRKGV
jgi:hypothetical protein